MIRDSGKDIGTSLFFYIIQLLLNYLWPVIFFSFRLYGMAFIELIVLFIFVGITFVKFIKLDKIADFIYTLYGLVNICRCIKLFCLVEKSNVYIGDY